MLHAIKSTLLSAQTALVLFAVCVGYAGAWAMLTLSLAALVAMLWAHEIPLFPSVILPIVTALTALALCFPRNGSVVTGQATQK